MSTSIHYKNKIIFVQSCKYHIAKLNPRPQHHYTEYKNPCNYRLIWLLRFSTGFSNMNVHIWPIRYVCSNDKLRKSNLFPLQGWTERYSTHQIPTGEMLKRAIWLLIFLKKSLHQIPTRRILKKAIWPPYFFEKIKKRGVISLYSLW